MGPQLPSPEGLLYLRVPGGPVALPVPPRTRPFRLLLGRCEESYVLVQRCVDPQFETVAELDFGAVGAPIAELIVV